MHSLTFDQTTREGSAIAALFNKIKHDVEDSETGEWDPVETTRLLTEWFTAQGIDVHDGLITGQTASGLHATRG